MSNIPFTHLDKQYIDGEWLAPEKGTLAEVINPATEAPIGMAPYGGAEDAQKAVAAAKSAFDSGCWSELPVAERIAYIEKFKQALLDRADDIKALLTAEVGSTAMLNEAVQFSTCISGIDYALSLAPKLEHAEQSPIESVANMMDPTGPMTIGAGAIYREPLGVVVGITPFNFPLLMNIFKLIPALLAGNTVIIKPSPLTPFSALLLGELADAAGLPAGVLNVVNGDDSLGQVLSSHPDVDMVTFTGSDKVGAMISKQAADTIKRVHLELGGKSALIIREDADIATAAMSIVIQCTTHAGQGCALHTRAIVHNSIRAQVAEMAAGILAGWTVGDPADPSMLTGPLVSAAAREKTENYVRIALEQGAKLVCGGKRPEQLDKGFFFEPTVLDDVKPDDRIAQEEVFGPVSALIGFDSDDEAVAIANNSQFGLHGGILSADKQKAFAMARRIRTGQVWINGGIGTLSMQVPFGGYKRSGIGRELGPNWLNEFTQEKAIVYPVG